MSDDNEMPERLADELANNAASMAAAFIKRGADPEEVKASLPPDAQDALDELLGERMMAASVPESAESIDSPEDAPEGTTVVQGPKGGWYYVPGSFEEAVGVTSPGEGAGAGGESAGGGRKPKPPDSLSEDARERARSVRQEVEDWTDTEDDTQFYVKFNEIVEEATGVPMDFRSIDRAYAPRLAEELVRLNEFGMLDNISSFRDWKMRSGGGEPPSKAAGAFNPESSTLWLFSRAWDHPRRLAEPPEHTLEAYREGHTSSKHPMGTLFHEIGHARHFEKDEDAEGTFYERPMKFEDRPIVDWAIERYQDRPLRDWRHAMQYLMTDVAAEVSTYAASLPGGEEIVAEVHAGLLTGEEYEPWVHELYEVLGGPEVTDEMIASVANVEDDWWEDELYPVTERGRNEGYSPFMLLEEGEDEEEATVEGDLSDEEFIDGMVQSGVAQLPEEYAASASYLHSVLSGEAGSVEPSDEEVKSMAAAVPENAISIRDPSDAPAGTATIQGPMGGWYYVPAALPGAEGETESGGDAPREDPQDRFAPSPAEDVPEFRESEESTAWVEDLHAVQYENGFTLNSDLSRYDGLGYVATITSDNFTHPDAGGEGVSKEDIVELYERMLPVLEEFPGIAKLGTFYGDDGYMSVDLNIVTDNRELAEAIGRANNQQAIWDLYEMAPINTDGTGESPVDASDPRAVLEFIRDIVEDGREAQALAALTPEASEATVTEYETETGERVSGLELFGKVKSGVWSIVDTDEEMWAVEDEDGDVVVLTAVNAGAQEMPEEGEERTMEGTEADTDRFISPFKQVPAATDYTDEEAAFHAMYEEVLWDEQAAGRELFAASRVPDNVRNRLVSAIRQGALFPEFEVMNDSQRAELREYLLNAARGEGWTFRELAMRLRRIDPTLTQYEAERIARTETQAIVTTARELWYEDEGDFVAEDTLFIWNGPQDGRTTDACEWLKQQANPRYGGEPKTLEELRELVAEASRKFFPDLEVRRWTVHPHERHTIVRYYEVGA